MEHIKPYDAFAKNVIVTENTDFYISYNEVDTKCYGDVTTAIVKKNDNPVKFFILNGNHSKQYKDIIRHGGSYADCIAYFKKNIDKKSSFSDNLDEN